MYVDVLLVNLQIINSVLTENQKKKKKPEDTDFPRTYSSQLPEDRVPYRSQSQIIYFLRLFSHLLPVYLSFFVRNL